MNTQSSLPPCRVCGALALTAFGVIDEREYHRCGQCQATLLAATHFLTRDAEIARYQLHGKDMRDAAYRNFLARLAEPLLARFALGRAGLDHGCGPAPAQLGLDYGCGPAPALAEMLTSAGHCVRLWDPYFHADESVLDHTYDFITCSEALEHFREPQSEFARIDRMLRRGGLLAVMTSFQTDDARFAQWYYRRDPTHVTFYREFTVRHIAASLGWSCEIPAANVAIMQKP